MFKKYLILLLVIPVIEMFILIQAGKIFGFWTTLGILITLGVLGIYLIKSQGLAVFGEIKNELARGQVPTRYLLDALLIIISGALLLTPGLLTDLFGLLLLVPPLRLRVGQKIAHVIMRYVLPNMIYRRW